MKVIDSSIFKTRNIIGDVMGEYHRYIGNKRIIVIADAKVMKYYPKLFIDFPVITIYSSESNKSLDSISYVFEKLLEYKTDRNTFLLGVGGGVVTDIAGFAASSFLRGLDFGLMPTTLLAMADAAVGGKNGVNFKGYKNVIGFFRQPDVTLTDTGFLNTLPQKDIYSGFSEIIKIAVIFDSELLNYMNQNYKSLLKLESHSLNYILEKAISIKQNIIEKDQFDKGVRKLLNFGHTFGHAIEAEYGESLYITHGEAVAMGMILAMKLSVIEGHLDKSVLEQTENLLEKFQLPKTINLDCKRLINKIKKDKKIEESKISMILIEDFSRPFIKNYDLCDLELKCYDVFDF